MAKVLPNIGELNGRVATVGFTDDDGLTAIPGVVEWRIVCPDNDSVITDWATATPVTTTDGGGNPILCEATITLPASVHGMVTTTLAKEQRAFIVAADKDTDDEWNEEFHYYVERRSARS
jgi:hypothetical protein